MKGHHLKAELQSLGVRIDPVPQNARLGGAGPAEGTVIFFGPHQASVPAAGGYVKDSPYHIRFDKNNGLLFRGEECLLPVEVPRKPPEYDFDIKGGARLSEIALLHGRDCLGSTVVQTCRNKAAGRGCAFCGIELSLESSKTVARKEPAQLAEAAGALRAGHAVLTTGTWSNDSEIVDHLAACAEAVKERGLPVQVQLCPPEDLDLLARLKDAGADAIALNAESPDESVLARVAPAKAVIGLDRYREAWKTAVGIFGKNNVISFILAGLGENDDSIVQLCGELCEIGVYPFLLPFRPIPGTPLGGSVPPRPHRMKMLYAQAAEAVISSGLSWREVNAGCGRCDACSALADFEDALLMESGGLHCARAVRPDEMERCMEVRHGVFVEEQKIFNETDRDELDESAIHIFCRRGREIIGAVRVHRDREGRLLGSRLSVLPGRRGGAGTALVRAAEDCARRLGGEEISGLVQAEQAGFFLALGWRKEGDEFSYFGRRHQVMVSGKL